MTLKEYLDKHNEKPSAFQKRSGVKHPKVYEYIAGRYKPRGDNMRRIKEATGGLVSANDFYA